MFWPRDGLNLALLIRRAASCAGQSDEQWIVWIVLVFDPRPGSALAVLNSSFLGLPAGEEGAHPGAVAALCVVIRPTCRGAFSVAAFCVGLRFLLGLGVGH